MFDTRNQIKKLMSDDRNNSLNSTEDNVIVRDDFDFAENIFIGDCYKLDLPIYMKNPLNISDSFTIKSSDIEISETTNISDEVNFITPPDTPYFTGNSARNTGFVVGRKRFAFTS